MAQRRALLIAVPEYRDDAIDSFPEVVRHDINGLETALRSSGYSQVTIRGIDSIWEATRPQIVDELERFFQSATDGDTLLVYLSGHGLHHNRRDYLVPTEAVIRDPAKYEDFLVRIDFAHLIQDSRAETIVFFVDACRQGVKLKHKAPYSIGWGMAHRAKVKRQCYVIVFACSAGELAQYVTGKDAYSLFTRSLSDVLCCNHSAQTLGDVLQASSDRLAELIEMHGKRPQIIRKVVESDVDEDAALSRVICNGSSDALSTSITLNPWPSAAMFSDIWEVEQITDEVALTQLKDSVNAIVNVCWQQWEKTVETLPDDAWRDESLPIRVLNNFSLLLYRSDPQITLSIGERALAVVAPFVREAIISAGTRRAATANPFSLDITGVTEAGPRSELEKVLESYPQLVRKSKRLEAQGEEDARRAVAAWLMYRSVFRAPQIWLPPPAGDLPNEIHSALNTPTEQQPPIPADILTADRITEFARCIFGEPERVERHDRVNAFKDELYLGGKTKEGRVREKLLAYLLILSGQLAIESRLLPDLLIDHLGLADPVTPKGIIETVRSVRWSTGGRALNLTVTCSHPAIDLALRDHVLNGSKVLETIIARGETSHPSLKWLKGLPIRLTPDEIRPASDENDNPMYQIPHIRFHLAQDEVRELLMGAQLYSNPTLAIRELYQNALDACRYRRARLDYLRATKQLSPILADWEGCIVFHQGFDEAGRPYIECNDNGIGMGRRELSECFARAGRRFCDTPEFIEEQAEWRKEGIELFPNSQFGIGVFSYFMLADELEIETCRLDRRGIPGKRLTVRVSGTGTLFRVVEEAGPPNDAGTRIRLYLNRTTYKKGPGKEVISCLDTLRELLWVAEFRTHVDEGVKSFMWEPDSLYHPKLDPSQWIKSSSASLWWITKRYGGYIHGHFGLLGAVLSDGIYVERDHAGEEPLTYVVNLTGSHRPNLSVDREKILAWDQLWIEQLLRESCMTLVDWPRLSLSWLWLLNRECSDAAEQLTAVLVQRNVSLSIGYISWHLTDQGYYNDKRVSEKIFDFIADLKVSIREVGCFPSDIGLFITIYKHIEQQHEVLLKALRENKEINRVLSQKTIYNYIFQQGQDSPKFSRELPIGDITSDWECPDWLKPERLKIWMNLFPLKIFSDLLPEYNDSSLPICPTLFPKDATLLNNGSKKVSPLELIRYASINEETLSATIKRLQRLSPLGFSTPEVNLHELGELTVSKNIMTAIADDGRVTLFSFLKAVAESGMTAAQVYETLSRFKPLGIQLTDIEDTAVVSNATFDKNDLRLFDEYGRITNIGLLEVAADTGQPIRFLDERIQALCQFGIQSPEYDLTSVADLIVSWDDFRAIKRIEVKPFKIMQLSAERMESVGATLRRLQRFTLLGIQIPKVNPTEFDNFMISKEELSPMSSSIWFSNVVTILNLLNIAATLNEPVKATFLRWQKMASLGMNIPLVNVDGIPDDLVFTHNDLKVMEKKNTISIISILKAAAQIGEPVAKTIKRARNFGLLGVELPNIYSPSDQDIVVTENDLRVLDDHGRIDLVSILKASAELGEVASKTYLRACKLKEFGLKIPKIASEEDLDYLILNMQEAAIISKDGCIGKYGVLWMSAQTGNSVASILKQLQRLSNIGIKLPRMPIKKKGDVTFNFFDIAAFLLHVALRGPDGSRVDPKKIVYDLYKEWNEQKVNPKSLYYSEVKQIKKISTMPFYIELIANALGESTKMTASRLNKFAIFGIIK